MVHSAVGVNHGVLHEAAVLVDLLLGDLRCSRWVSRTVELFRRRGGGVAGVLKYPAPDAASDCSSPSVGGRFSTWTLVRATWGS